MSSIARCDNCGAVIAFGGEIWNGMRFCSEECVQTALTASRAREIPADSILQQAMQIRESPCPQCGGEGPVDVHEAWAVYSLLIVTFPSRQEIVGCRWCGIKHKLKYFLFTGLFGWWGIPWGILLTPYYEVKNAINLSRGVPLGPSEALKEMALGQISAEMRHRFRDEHVKAGKS